MLSVEGLGHKTKRSGLQDQRVQLRVLEEGLRLVQA